LFLDRNGDGTVSSAAEFSFVDDVNGARSDLEGLRAFDSNGDGQLSAADVRFAAFGVWQDRDGDGVAEAGEILTLAAANIRSLSLAGTAVNAETALGDVAVVNRGTFVRSNGSSASFIDAALTYFASATETLGAALRTQSVAGKAKDSRINVAGGNLFLVPRKARGEMDSEAGKLGGASLLSFRDTSIGMLSTIILDLDGDGVEMRAFKKTRALFDMDGNGGLDDTGWVGKGDGLLVIDRNRDGVIAGPAELSFASEDPSGRSGLGGLARLDSNGDGFINARDARFAELQVWVDANANGVTDAGELRNLSDLGITEINLTARAREATVKIGDNALVATTTFTRNGVTATLGQAALAFKPAAAPPPPIDQEIPPGPDDFNLETALAALGGAAESRSLDDLLRGQTFAVVPADLSTELQVPMTETRVAAGLERQLAIMRQDMASFGVLSGENELLRSRHSTMAMIDFFAQ
jgi:hypothetical protein